MNFDMTPEEARMKEGLKSLFREDPQGADGLLRRDDPEVYRKRAKEWMRRLAAVGYLELGVARAKNSTALAAAQEELAACNIPLYLTAEISARLFGRIAARLEDQAILELILSGSAIGAAALSEANASYDQNPPASTAQAFQGSFAISGSKDWVANASIADWIACLARLGDKDAIFIIDASEKGLVVGEGIETCGIQGIFFHPIYLSECHAEGKDAIVLEDVGITPETIKLWEDQILTSLSLGIMQRAYDNAVNHAKSHSSGGKPIIAYQEVGFKLAEMLTLVQTARLLAYRAAWMDEIDHKEARMLCRCAKVFCAENAEEVTAMAMQILGVKALFGTGPVSSYYMAANYAKILGTSVERSMVKIGDGVLATGC